MTILSIGIVCFLTILLILSLAGCGAENQIPLSGIPHTDHDWFLEAELELGSQEGALNYAQLYGACI